MMAEIDFPLIQALLILLGLALAWLALKVLLRFTFRIFGCGCIALVTLVGIGWAITRVL
jgi:hypothetical protein